LNAALNTAMREDRRQGRRRARRLGSVLAPALLLLAALPGAAQEKTFSESTSVVVVEVPVRVLVKGKPLGGLTAADFALYDQGRKVEHFDFEVLDSSPPADGATAPAAVGRPGSPGRNLLVVYDFALNANRPMLFGATASLRRAVAERLGPADRVAIALFRGHPQLLFVVDFTSDRRQILAALDVVDLMLAGDFYATRDRLRELRAGGAVAAEARRFGGGWGTEPLLPVRARRFTGEREVPSDPLTAETLALFDYRLVSDRKLVLNLTRALVAMSESTRDLRGPKELILLSTGFDDMTLFGTKKTVGTLSVVRRIIRAFRTENWTLQAVSAGLGMGSTSIFNLSYETGGELYTNSNDVGLLLGEMFEHTAVSYLLSFQPQGLEHDGRFHRLKVELVGGPRGARVIHRRAYRAPEPEEPQTAPEKQDPGRSG
jgi:VWFA-related protein